MPPLFNDSRYEWTIRAQIVAQVEKRQEKGPVCGHFNIVHMSIQRDVALLKIAMMFFQREIIMTYTVKAKHDKYLKKITNTDHKRLW